MSLLRVISIRAARPGCPVWCCRRDWTRGGLPVALEFDGAAGSDRALLALGAGLELALGPLSPPKEI